MPHASDPDLLVLTGLRLTSFAPAERVAEVIGRDVDDVTKRLDALAGDGFVRHRGERTSGWLLTPAGRAEGEARLAAELDATGARPVVAGAYERFLELNRPLLDACTDWQLREVDGQQVPNDHADADHDAAAVAGLSAIDDAVQPVCAVLAGALERFASYGPRLATARQRVEAGEGDWFTRPTIDSYHSVWFELHEHLLASLGLDRSGERSGDAGTNRGGA